MPPRACHGVRFSLPLSAVAENALGRCAVGEGFLRSCSGRPSESPRCTAARSRRSLPDLASVPDPRSPWAAPAGSPNIRQDGPGHQGQFGGRSDLLAKTIGAPLPASVGRQRQPFDRRDRDRRPRSAPVNGSEVLTGVLVKTRIMDERRAEGGCARPASVQIKSSQTLRARQGGWPEPELPGFWRPGVSRQWCAPYRYGEGRTSAPRPGLRPFP